MEEGGIDGAAERYPHLDPTVAQVACRADTARLKFLQEDRFIPYGAADAVLKELNEVLTWPNTVRPPCRLLVAHSDMGKSTIFSRFCAQHPASDNIGGEAAHVPVMKMQFPESGSDGVYGEIIRKLNAETTANPSSRALRSQALHLLNAVGNRVLIIDEIANVIVKDIKRQTIAMNAIKFITNEMERPVVLGVTREAFTLVIADKHLKSRFEPLFLPRFKDVIDEEGKSEYREFLYGFEVALPLKKPSNLAQDNALAHEIMVRTFGVTGAISRLLVKSAVAAIESGEERITLDIIKSVVWNDSESIKKRLDDL